jgi:hypothetical protein
MRICPEFPSDNPVHACDSSAPPRVRFAEDAPESTHVAAPRPSGIFLVGECASEPAFDLPFECDVQELDLVALGFDMELEAVDDDDAWPIEAKAWRATSDDDPFVLELLPVVRDVAGANADAAIQLFELGEVPEDARARSSLMALGAVEPGNAGGPARTSQAFRAAMTGWRAVLRGDLDDVEACGGRMLDEWVAEIVAAIQGQPAKAPELRRALRARGVCAFGLIRAA